MDAITSTPRRSLAAHRSSTVVGRRIGGRVAWPVLRYVILTLFALFILFPIYWVAVTAFKVASDLQSYPPVLFPMRLTLANVDVAMTRFSGLEAFKNSFIVASASAIIALIFGTLAGYSMARFNTGGRNLSTWLLSQKMLPGVSFIFPTFVLFKFLNWIDTYQALIILYAVAALPFTVWMTRSYIVEIPVEIEDSALVDGCRRLEVIWHITLPLAAPGMATVGIFVFVWGWTEFLFAVIMTRTNTTTLPVVISSFFSQQQNLYGAGAALALLAMLPVFILALTMQRHLVRGLTLGAIKG